MSVRELSQNELEELKSALFYELVDNDKLEEVAPDANCFLDLSDDLVYDHFDGIDFVEEDFFCNI